MDPALAEVARLLQATPTRMAVLASLNIDGPQTRGELMSRLGLGVGAVQHQLMSLREIGLVVAVPLEEPDRYHRTEYRIASEALIAIYRTLGLGLGLTA
ncbi:ArsR/SmtB family transcription factor [Subtercola boreus]|nr:winged helix-turn-helix domain-containing protein [Subtercola boreus]